MPALEPRSRARGRSRPATHHDTLDLERPIDLVVLAVKQRAARCRLVDSDGIITLRAGLLHRLVPGQIATVQPNRQWQYAGHPYLSGTILSATTDVGRLGLVPLALHPFGEWDPAEEYWGEPDDPIEDFFEPIIARGCRPLFEMEQVLPGHDPEDFDTDPILDANDLREAGDPAGAHALLSKLLEADLRCLDAHAHLGNMSFRGLLTSALAHYEIGVRIGELSLGANFDGVLPWDLVDNRPFLRCLHGYALCLWRLGRWDEAERVLLRMLWLDPSDPQGMRLILPQVQRRETWLDDER